ncbi:MAG: metallophosphoesterase [Flavobacterium sp.]|nr:metallophosphoesterase [Candidatus Neoflavobacterium equi]
MKNIDFIGDIHGYADALVSLLETLGYSKIDGTYTHPANRKVVFVGDFIDRGPKIRETLHIVKNMCDAGTAFAVMGNHEYNAICYHRKSDKTGMPFREHTQNNIFQHKETVSQFKEYPEEWKMFLSWFERLPIWIETEDFRVVHAYWNEDAIAYLKYPVQNFTSDFLDLCAAKGTDENLYVEYLLKGAEYDLPLGVSYFDAQGHKRYKSRVMWWNTVLENATYNDLLIACPPQIQHNYINNLDNQFVYVDEKPIVFGHYWLNGEPVITNPNAICIDYSIAKKGKLVSYALDTKSFTYVN